MTMLLKGAIIGFGSVAEKGHLPLFQKYNHFRIDAVVEPSPERAARARQMLPHARIYSNMEHLLPQNNLDFVDICTPPCYHAEHVLRAYWSGLHVLCEKPLVTSLESFQRIKDAAREFNRVIFTVNNWKYAPIWQKVSEIVHNGAIGEIHSLSLTVLRTSTSGGGISGWRKCVDIAGGGILLDHGWHNIYLILSLIKESPLSVSAHMEYSHSQAPCLEETVELNFIFPKTEAKLFLTWQATERQNCGTIIGEKGTLNINDDHLILHSHKHNHMRYDFDHALSQSSHHPEWMEPVIREFYREVVDREKGGDNLKEAAWCAQLTHHAYESHKEQSRFIPVLNPFE